MCSGGDPDQAFVWDGFKFYPSIGQVRNYPNHRIERNRMMPKLYFNSTESNAGKNNLAPYLTHHDLSQKVAVDMVSFFIMVHLLPSTCLHYIA